jgi:hypothetical protein
VEICDCGVGQPMLCLRALRIQKGTIQDDDFPAFPPFDMSGFMVIRAFRSVQREDSGSLLYIKKLTSGWGCGGFRVVQKKLYGELGVGQKAWGL